VGHGRHAAGLTHQFSSGGLEGTPHLTGAVAWRRRRATARDLSAGCARRMPVENPKHAGSNPAASKSARATAGALLEAPSGDPIPAQDLQRPRDRILHAYASRLRTCPELKVLRPVVVLDAVLVVNGLVREQRATEELLHHDDVLKHIPARS